MVGDFTRVLSSSITRPADTTAYASGDLVANSTTAGSVTPFSWPVTTKLGGSGMVRRVRIRKSGTSTTNASFRVHLYNASPTPSNGDNGAWLTNKADNYMGYFDVTVGQAFTDGAAGNGAPAVGAEVNFDLLLNTVIVYGLLEARGAYTPASAEVITVSLEVCPD
jgi:hypothetical protein